LEENKAMIKSMRDSTDEEDGDSEDGEDDEWEGFAEPPAVDYEAEYIDEDKYTTVTVEDLDPSKGDEAEFKEWEEKKDKANEQKGRNPTSSVPRKNARAKGKPDKSKNKKKFRYEEKADRKFTQAKSRAANGARARARREK
jgi:ribosomal RNA-processing protein 17